MKLNSVSGSFAVAPQPRPEELKDLSGAGFTTVVCNRPEGEEADQPTMAEMRQAAAASGLEFYEIPVAGGVFPDDAVAAFAKVRREADGKVLAYCRTGMRAVTLDALANVENASAEQRVERARDAGYDISAMRERLDA